MARLVRTYSRISNDITSTYKWKTALHMAYKRGEFDVVEMMVKKQFEFLTMKEIHVGT